MGVFRFGWSAAQCSETARDRFQLPWVFDYGALTIDDYQEIARLICWKFAFSEVHSGHRGGCRLVNFLRPHCEAGYPVLIVDDVLVTGRAMAVARRQFGADGKPVIGIVILARGKCPDWVWPILSVNEWAQSRATGLG
jgi:hypoxanthine phosphoribosyltransferase